MNQKLRFLCFIHNSLPPVWAKLGYFWIKIDHIADSLLKLQIEIGVHLISVELLQLLTLDEKNGPRKAVQNTTSLIPRLMKKEKQNEANMMTLLKLFV